MGKEGTTTNVGSYGKEITNVQIPKLTPNLMECSLGYSNSYEPLQLLHLVRGTTCEIIVGGDKMKYNIIDRQELEFGLLASFTEITYKLSSRVGFAVNELSDEHLEKEIERFQTILKLVKED